jgi:hypothetical protein
MMELPGMMCQNCNISHPQVGLAKIAALFACFLDVHHTVQHVELSALE